MKIARRVLCTIPIVLSFMSSAIAMQSAEERNLNELRNTVVNLLQTLVQHGVLTREQAEAMVKSAQDKAAADAAVSEKQQQEEAGAVRVPYVPQIVRDEIKKEVTAELAPEVTQQVIAEAKSEQWGVPGALPDWIKQVTLGGDVRVRAESDLYPTGNAQGVYLNYNAVNSAGGISKAGDTALLNTSVDRHYLLVRLRFDMNALLSGGWHLGTRLSTGTLVNPDSLNQVMGQYGGRYQTNIDLAYLSWMGGDASGRQLFSFWGGKFPNPYVYSDLTWMPDVTFEGLAARYRVGVSGNPTTPHYWFLTASATPEENIPLMANYGPSSGNKWLYAGQTGFDVQTENAHRLRFGVAYYYFRNFAGVRNTLDSNLTDYTAPPYMQKGNTLFDIRNSTDPTQNLFALAADFHELDAMFQGDFWVSPRYQLSFFADYVKNLGYKEPDVAARVGLEVPARVKGYEAQLTFGAPKLDYSLAWDAFLGYRYIQRDAVVDAFTDQDYHLGGTDAKGYMIGTDLSLTDHVWLRARYMPFSAIDGPPLAINVWQVEVNAHF